jgi:NifU-like protein involved in Fe-S cluster formation
MTEEEFEALAFDPPHLGMPGRPSSCGRNEEDGRFVEIFLAVEDGRVIDAGFLTNIPGDGLVCASLCCDAALGRTIQDAAALGEEECLAGVPEAASRALGQAGLCGLCLRAMRRAVDQASAHAG